MSKKLVKILDLHCCQMALGMLEVREKAKEFKKLSNADFLNESKEDPVEIIIGPDGHWYLTDGHHTALAALIAGFKKIFATVKRDDSKKKISMAQFWKKLKKENCVHLYDQFGEGPHEPFYLPIDVRGLSDDPYRSLAWLAKEAKAFKDSSDRFADFKWANFYRDRKLLQGRKKKDFKRAKKKAVVVSHLPAAKGLPGYVPRIQ